MKNISRRNRVRKRTGNTNKEKFPRNQPAVRFSNPSALEIMIFSALENGV
jgi:hypothetical protein